MMQLTMSDQRFAFFSFTGRTPAASALEARSA
jgi:hypothetical protein